MGVTVTIDKMALLEAMMKAMDTASVLVGIPSASEKNVRDDTPETNAEIGFVNEFGEPSMNIPPRPFLVPGVMNSMDKNTRVMMRGAQQAMSLSGNPESQIQQTLDTVGLIAQQAVQAQIIDGEYTPLAPYTLAQRRSRGFVGEKPLIETGSLKNSITYVVEKNA